MVLMGWRMGFGGRGRVVVVVVVVVGGLFGWLVWRWDGWVGEWDSNWLYTGNTDYCKILLYLLGLSSSSEKMEYILIFSIYSNSINLISI